MGTHDAVSHAPSSRWCLTPSFDGSVRHNVVFLRQLRDDDIFYAPRMCGNEKYSCTMKIRVGGEAHSIPFGADRRQLLHNPLHHIHRHNWVTVRRHLSPLQLFGSELIGTHVHTHSPPLSPLPNTPPPRSMKAVPADGTLSLSPGLHFSANQVVHRVLR